MTERKEETRYRTRMLVSLVSATAFFGDLFCVTSTCYQ